MPRLGDPGDVLLELEVGGAGLELGGQVDGESQGDDGGDQSGDLVGARPAAHEEQHDQGARHGQEGEDGEHHLNTTTRVTDDEQPDEDAEQVVLHPAGLERPQPALPARCHSQPSPLTAPSMTVSSKWCQTQREPSTARRTKVACVELVYVELVVDDRVRGPQPSAQGGRQVRGPADVHEPGQPDARTGHHQRHHHQHDSRAAGRSCSPIPRIWLAGANTGSRNLWMDPQLARQAQEAAQRRGDGQHDERHDHRPGALVDVLRTSWRRTGSLARRRSRRSCGRCRRR